MTPGYEKQSVVVYKDSVQGVYIKFGDQGTENPGKVGIRNAYLTHNPDIGVACVLSSEYTGPLLGTRLKNFIIEQCRIAPVEKTEWFSVKAKAGWKLFEAMLNWDATVIDHSNIGTLETTLLNHLR